MTAALLLVKWTTARSVAMLRVIDGRSRPTMGAMTLPLISAVPKRELNRPIFGHERRAGQNLLAFEDREPLARLVFRPGT
ncbi:MAG: hypothetical protein VX929_14640, partial [Pseudomonadota bacterium]|nr:hypothetical protein [Pseudomonadota bacterium]